MANITIGRYPVPTDDERNELHAAHPGVQYPSDVGSATSSLRIAVGSSSGHGRQPSVLSASGTERGSDRISRSPRETRQNSGIGPTLPPLLATT